MSLLLHIDTALESASLAISEGNNMIAFTSNDNQKDHAAWIHTAIEKMMKECNRTVQDLDAVSVTIGPGSYTGLRVGLSSAKGICYAANKPLLTIPTLELIASVVNAPEEALICPMIDARRMEVFTATYSSDLKEIEAPYALVLDENSFSTQLNEKEIFFVGNGAAKFQSICQSPHAFFDNTVTLAAHMIPLGLKRFQMKIFSDLAYSSPLYVKEFQSTTKIK